jgi:hypothetical protein
MNFKQTLIFYKHKIQKYENLNVFYMCLIIHYYYKNIEHQRNYIMKTKGLFLKVISLNEIIKDPLF